MKNIGDYQPLNTTNISNSMSNNQKKVQIESEPVIVSLSNQTSKSEQINEYKVYNSNQFIQKPQNKMSILLSSKDNDYKETLNRIWENYHIMNDGIFDKEAILVCGDTGSGKSTLVNYLLGRNLYAEEAENNNFLQLACKDAVASIGHDCESKTSIPGRYQGVETYWDCPGFEDTGGFVSDISNAFSISKIGEKAENIKILAVIEEPDITSKRATAFRGMISKITKMLGNRPDLADSVTLCFTKACQIKDYKSALLDIANSKTKSDFNSQEKEFLKNVVKNGNVVIFPRPTQLGKIDNSVRDQLIKQLKAIGPINKPVIDPVIAVKSLQPLNELYTYTNDQITDTLKSIGDKVSFGLSITKDLEPFVQSFSKVTKLILNTEQTPKNIDVIDAFEWSLNCLEFDVDIRDNITKNLDDIRFLSKEVFERLFGKYFPDGEKFEMTTLGKPFVTMTLSVSKELKARNLNTLGEYFNKESGFAGMMNRIQDKKEQPNNVNNTSNTKQKDKDCVIF